MEFILRDPEQRVASANEPFLALHYDFIGPPVECEVLCVVSNQAIIKEHSPECDQDGMPLNWVMIYEVPLSHLSLLSDFEKIKQTSTLLMPTGVRELLDRHKMLDYFDSEAKNYPGIDSDRLAHIRDNLKKEISLHYAASENRTKLQAFCYDENALEWYQKYLGYYNGKKFENDVEVLNVTCLLNKPLCFSEVDKLRRFSGFSETRESLGQELCLSAKWYSIVEIAAQKAYFALENFFDGISGLQPVIDLIEASLAELERSQDEDKRLSYKYECYLHHFEAFSRTAVSEHVGELCALQLQLLPFLALCLAFELSVQPGFVHDERYYFLLVSRRFHSKFYGLFMEHKNELVQSVVCGGHEKQLLLEKQLKELRDQASGNKEQSKQRQEQVVELEQQITALRIHPSENYFLTAYAWNGEPFKYKLKLHLNKQKIAYCENIAELQENQRRYVAFVRALLSGVFCEVVLDMQFDYVLGVTGTAECEAFFKEQENEENVEILYGLFSDAGEEKACAIARKTVDFQRIFKNQTLSFNFPRYCLEYGEAETEISLLSPQYRVVLEELQERINITEMQRSLAKWLRENVAYNGLLALVRNASPEPENGVTEQSIEKSVIFEFTNNQAMFKDIESVEIFSGNQLTEIRLLLNTLPDALFFDDVKYELAELKHALKQWVFEILNLFVKQVMRSAVMFNQVIETEGMHFSRTIKKYQYRPEKFGYLLRLEQLLSDNALLCAMCAMYVEICDYWVWLNNSVSLVLDQENEHISVVELSSDMVLRQVGLVIEIRGILRSIEGKIPAFCHYIDNLDHWMRDQAYKIQARVKEIMLVTEADYECSFADALTFQQKFPDICKNYVFPLLQLCQNKDFEQHEQEFLNSLAKYTTLPLKSVRYNFAQMHSQWRSKQSNIEKNEKSECLLYERDKITFKKNSISVFRVVQETCYISGELYRIYRTVHLWRRLLQQLTVSSVPANLNESNEPDFVYPSFQEMNGALIAIAVLLEYESTLRNELKQRQLQKFNAEYAIDCLDILSETIVTLQSRLGAPYSVHNELYDFYKIGLSEPRDDFVAFTVSYESWREKVMGVEGFVIDRIQTVYLAYLVKNVVFTNKLATELREKFDFRPDCLLDGTIDSLLDEERAHPEMLDSIVMHYQEEQLDGKSILELRNIKRELNEYVYQDKVRFGPAESSIDVVLVHPLGFEVFFQDAMKKAQAIINQTYLQLSMDYEPQRYHEIVLNEIYRTHILTMERRAMFSQQVHLFARDLEAALQAARKLFALLRKIPLFLRDLMLVAQNGILISVDGRRDGGSHVFSVLAAEQLAQIEQARQQWDDIIRYTFAKPVHLYALTQNQQLLIELAYIFNLVESVHGTLYSARFAHPIKELTQQYNRTRNVIESSFALRVSYSTRFGESGADVDFIPLHNQTLFVEALLLPTHVQVYFARADFINEALQIKEVSTIIFCNYRAFIAQDELITGIQTEHEELKFAATVYSQQPLIHAITALKRETTHAFKEQCKCACYELKRIYPEYRRLVLAGFDESARVALILPFFEKFVYEALNIALSTVFRSVYTRFLFDAFTKKQGESLMPEEMIAKDVKSCFDPPDCRKTELLAYRLAEWKQIFTNLQDLSGRSSGDDLLLKLDTFPILHYDTKSDSVLTVFNHGGFSLQAHDQFMGHSAADYQLSFKDMNFIVKILECLQERTTIVFTGNEADQYRNAHINKFVCALQNYQQAKTVYAVVSESSFAECMKRICALLINGSNVLIFGAELLSQDLCVVLIKFVQLVQRGEGSIPFFASCFAKKDAKELTTEFSNDFEYIQDQFATKHANFDQFPNCGQPMLFIPVLRLCQCPESNHDKYITPNIPILHINKNEQVIQLEFESLEDKFGAATQTFAKQFYTLSVSLSMLNDDYPKFSCDMIEMILTKTQNKTEPLSVAVMTMDVLLHQTVELYFEKDSANVARELTNIVASAFGLQKEEQKQLYRIAAYYCRYLSSRLFNQVSTDITAELTFDDYFSEQLQQYANQMYLFYIEVFSKVQFLPIQMLYDVLYVNDLLKAHKPILAISPQSQYSRIFISMLAAIKDWEYDYVVDKEEMEQVIYRASANSSKQRIIGIQCTSLLKFAELFEHLIGFSLCQPVVPACFGELVYYDSIDTSPYIVCFVDAEMIDELRKSNYYRLFTNKIILSPVIQNSVGVRQIVQAPLRNAFITLSTFLKTLGCSEELYSLLQANLASARQIGYGQLKGPPMSTILKRLCSYSGSFPETKVSLRLSHMYINFMHRSTQTLKEHEAKIFSLKYFTAGLIEFLFEQVSSIYQQSHNIQEVFLLRSAMYFFMERMGLMHRRHGTAEKMRLNTHKMEAVERLLQQRYSLQTDENAQYQNTNAGADIYDLLSPNNTLYLQEGHLLSDVSGFYSRDIQDYNKYARSLGNQQVDKMVEKSVDHFSFTAHDNFGLGYTDNYSYYFNYEFFARYFLSQPNIMIAFRNIALPIIASVWNACYLYAVVTKTKSNEYETQYRKFIALFKMLLFKQNNFYTHLLEPFAYLLAYQENVPGINRTAMQYMTQYARSTILQMKLNLQPEYVSSCIHRLHTLILDVMPEQYKENQFYYITIDKERILSLKNREYKLGEGIFESIKDDVESEILLSLRNRLNASKTGTDNQYSVKKEVADKYKCTERPMVFDPFSALQQIDSDGALYLDSERVAFSCLLATAMLAPISVAVVGNRAEGKSTLINVAKLIVEDAVDNFEIFLSSYQSKGDVEQLINAVTRHYGAKSLFAADEKQYNILDEDNDHGYPCFHIQASDCTGTRVEDSLALLIRDHIIRFDMRSGSSACGCYSLSDSSFVVELERKSPLEEYCGVALSVPRITEQYISYYLKYVFAHADSEALKEYITGFFMIQQSLPQEICDNYVLIEKMVENTKYLISGGRDERDAEIAKILDGYSNQRDTDEMQETEQILKQAKDGVLLYPNMHQLFYALRQVGCINNIIMQVISERISSLTLLGYMKSGAQSPWGDSDIVETGRFMFYNAWESFLVNYCVKAQRSGNVQVNREYIRTEAALQSVLLPAEIDGLSCDDASILLALRSSFVNKFWFGHVVETAKQLDRYDPLLFSKSIEVFIEIFARKQRISSIFNVLGVYGIDYLTRGVGDGLMPGRMHIVANCGLRRKGQQQLSRMPLALSYALQPVQYYVNLQDSTIQNYRKIIEYIQTLSQYELASSDTPLASKVVLDLKAFAGVAEFDNAKMEAQEGAQISLYAQLQHYFFILQKTLKTQNNAEVFVIVTVLRIAIGLALGIKPAAFLITESLSQAATASRATSVFESDLFAPSIPGGLNISQIPIGEASHERLANDSEYSDEFHGTILEDYAEYIEEQVDVILVAPKSLMLLENDDGVTLMQLLEYSLSPLNQNIGLLSENEASALCRIVAAMYELDYLPQPHELSVFLSLRLSFLMVNDDCAGKNYVDGEFVDNQITYNIENIRSLGTIKSPIVEFLQNIEKFQASVVRDAYHEREHVIEAVNIAPPEPPVRITDTRLIQLQNKCTQYRYNIIQLNLADLVTLFNISNCQLPQKFVFPESISYDYDVYVHEYTLGALQCYEFFTTLANGPTVSLPQFTHMASAISNLILRSCQEFFSELSNVFLAYRFYEILSGARTRSAALDFHRFDLEKLKGAVRESTMQSINGKDIEMADTSSQAIIEYVVLREYFMHIIDTLKDDFQEYAGAVVSSHFDAICIACYTTFYSTALITDEQTEQTLANLPTQDNNLKQEKLINMSFSVNNICQFNLLIISRLLECGFRVAYPYQEDEKGFLTLGKNAIVKDRELFLSHFLDTCSYDWPIFLILHTMGIPWTVNDPQYYTLATAAMYFATGKSIFFVDEMLSSPVSVLIEALKKENQFNNHFSNDTREALDAQSRHGPGEVLVNELLKRVVAVDINSDPCDFEMQLARALGTEDCSILIRNFGESSPNNETIRSFIEMKLSGAIGRRTLIKIGRATAITNNVLNAYTVILALEPNGHLGAAMKGAGMLTQNVLDNSYIGIEYNKQRRATHAAESKEVVSELIISACFGNSSSARSLRECIRTYNQAEHQALTKASTRTFQFVRQKLFGKGQQNAQKSVGIDELWEQISRLYIELQKQRNMTEYSSILHDGQQDDLVDLFRCYQSLEFESEGKAYLMDSSREYVTRGRFQELKCQHFRYMCAKGSDLISEISTAIIKMNELLSGMGTLQTSLQFVLAAQELENMEMYLHERLTKLRPDGRLLAGYEANETGYDADESELDLHVVSPISYEILFNSEQAIRQISQFVMQFIDSRIRVLCPANLSSEVAQYARFLFLSQIEFIRFKYENVVETDMMHAQGKRENQEFTLLQEIMVFSFDDYISLISGAQVLNIMAKKSKFSLTSQTVKCPPTLKKIREIYPCLPDICKLASNIAFCWLGLSHLGLTDYYIELSLSWFISHTSALISLTDSAQPFVACMFYYQNNGAAEESRFAAGINALYKRYSNVQAIPQLPVAFHKLSDASIFSLLLISIVVKPTILAELMSQYNLVMDNLFNTIELETQRERSCEYKIPASNRAIQLLNRLSGGVAISENAEFDILCDSLKDVCQTIDQNKTNAAFVVYFYDKGCELREIISYLIAYLFAGSCDVLFEFNGTAYAKNASIFVLELDQVSLSELKQIMDIAKTSATQSQNKHLPVYILVQNEGKLADYMLEHEPARFNARNEPLRVMRESVGLQYHYFERPLQLGQRYLYYLNLALATLHAVSLNEERDAIPIASYRGFSLFLLREALRAMYGCISCDDSDCLNRISHVYSVSTSKLVKQRLDVQNSDFAQVLRCDQIYFDESTQSDSLLEQHIDDFVRELLSSSTYEENPNERRVYRTRERFSNVKADPEQLKQNNGNSSSEDDSDAPDIATDTQTMRFNQQVKVLNNLTLSGGKIKSAELITGKVAKKIDDPLDMIASNLAQADARLEQVEDFSPARFKASVLQYFAQDRELFEIEADTSIYAFSTYPESIPTFEAFLEFTNAIKTAEKAKETPDSQQNTEIAENANKVGSQPEKPPERDVSYMRFTRHQAQRYVFSAPFSQKLFSRAQYKGPAQKVAQMPGSFRAFVTKINGFESLSLENRMCNSALEDLLLDQLICQENNYFGAESMLSRFGNCYMINCCMFQPVMGHILNYVRIRNSLKTGTPLSQQQLLFSVVKPRKQALINKNQEVVDLEDRPDVILQMRGFELIGAAYDHLLDTVCDETPEMLSGFGGLMDIYAISCTCEGQSVKRRPGFVNVPIFIGGYCEGFVQLENKTERADCDWERRGIAFCVRKE